MRVSPLAVSALLWVAFIAYWSVAAARDLARPDAAPTIGSESPASRRLHQRLMYGALLCALALRVPPLSWRWLPAWPALVPCGLAVQVASAALAIWARRHLGRNWSGAITTKAGHQLVRTGPYRRVRHPIYSAMLGMFLGTALVSGAWHGLVGLAVMSLAYGRKIRLEEARLREIFGEEYSTYARESGALIPGLR